MIFKRALKRELTSTAGAVFTTLFTITITWMLIRILGQAAGGKIASGDVIALIGFTALNYLPLILILTSFISVLLVVSRSYQDSEMVVWFASGLSLSEWIGPVLSFGLPLVVLTGLLSFLATPWANQRSAEYIERFEKREDLARVSPGKFQESSTADRIFFVEGVSGDAAKVHNIFVNTVQNGRNSVIVAKDGAINIDPNGDKFLVMDKGRRYEGVATQADFQIMEFERYGVLILNHGQAMDGEKSTKSLSTAELLHDPNRYNLAELTWRIGVPLMCLILMLLAIPLGFVNPRVGRSANLIVALFMYITYSNMVSVFQASVAQGRFSFAMSWWVVHLVAILIVALAFLWRLNVNSAFHPLVLWAALKRVVFRRTVSK